MERNLGPLIKLLPSLDRADPNNGTALRRELEDLTAHYFENNTLRQDYLLTRAGKI